MLAMCFFISLLGYGLIIKTLLPQIKLGVSIFCAFICMALFSYTSMIILGVFIFSAYVLMFGGIAAFIIAGILNGIKYKRNKYSLLTKSDLFTILIYVICVIGFTTLLLSGVLKVHDAYSFWARAARELYLFDKGYFNADTNIAHWDYNPIFATLQYAITRVFGWQTKYLYYVIIGLFTSSLCAIMEFIESGYKSKFAFLFLTVLFYPMITMTYSTTFLGADGSMALLFVTGILCWHSREKEDIAAVLPIILAATILPAVKLYSGLMFSVVLCGVILVSVCKNKNKVLKRGLIVMIAGILYMQFSWSAYYNYNVDKADYERRVATYEYQGIENDISAEEPVFNISYFIKGNPRTKQLSAQVDESKLSEMLRLSKETIRAFVGAPLYNSSMHIVTIIFLTMFAYILLAKTEKKLGRRQSMLYTGICLWTAAIIYILGMFGTYLVQPGTANEPIRYIGVVVIPMVIALLYYACKYWDGKDELSSGISKNILLIVLLILSLDCEPAKVYNAYSAGETLEYKPATYVQSVLENDLGEIWKQCSDQERVLIIDNKEENAGLGASGVLYAYHYYALPRRGKALYFEFGDKKTVEIMTTDYLENTLIQNRINAIIIMADDEDLQNKLESILAIPVNEEGQIVDVIMYDGELHYSLRKDG